jgi:hypothetical protein
MFRRKREGDSQVALVHKQRGTTAVTGLVSHVLKK